MKMYVRGNGKKYKGSKYIFQCRPAVHFHFIPVVFSSDEYNSICGCLNVTCRL